ncbi:MAG: ABC transporter ATP-binding protein [Phycisphaeraceae bacterium]|nr:ABC transporter ATP-binding protein [Phycisphaeraceae bacterium]
MISNKHSEKTGPTPNTPTEKALSCNDWAIQTEHLTKIYGQRLIAVNDMALEVPKGSVFGLLGPNGAGKTTTLRLLLGLQRPTGGWAKVFGETCGPNAVNVRSVIGYLPTNPKLPGHLRPIEYLDLLGKLCRLPHAVRKPRISSLLRAVGLLGATNQLIRTFSTGMCTRLGIAASLVADPPLLIWDEPTAGLDPSARRFTLDLISELSKTKTVVIATHILNDIDQICDHLGIMQEGRMIYTGSMTDLKQRLGGDEFCLELNGRLEAIDQVKHEVIAMGFNANIRDERYLQVHLTDDQTRAPVLAKILHLIDEHEVRLEAIHSSQNTTENAYLQLLQEEQAHGFDR